MATPTPDEHNDRKPTLAYVEDKEAPISSKDAAMIDGDVHLLDHSGHVRHIPIPSVSPRDPLNWSKQRKILVLIAICWYSVMSLSLVSGIGPVLPTFMHYYIPTGTSPTDVLKLVTWPGLFVGLGNFVFLPLALVIGRRPTFLLSSLMLLGATIGAALSTSFHSNLTARCFQGLGAGITESLLPLIITDMTFTHERGFYFGIYWTTQNILSNVLSIASSYQASSLGWRWYYGIFAVINAFGILLAVLFVPETRFNRPAANINGHVFVTDEYGVQRILSDDEALEIQQEMDLDMTPLSFGQGMRLWNGVTPGGWGMAGRSYVSMLQCLTSPGMLWAVIWAGVMLAIYIGLSLTYANILIGPLGWPEANAGLIQIGQIPAGIAALVFTGKMMDIVAIRNAKANNGIHTPEARLPVTILPSLVGIAATIVYGFADDEPTKYGWPTVVIMNSIFCFSFVSSLIVVTTFGVEVCPLAAGPALVIAVGLKNVVAFAITFGISDLLNTRPGKVTYGILAGILAGASLLAIPVYFFNAKWRRMTSGRVHN